MNSPRRPSRLTRWTLFAALLALGLGGVLAALVADRSLKITPAAFLVAIDGETAVRLRWKTRKLATALTVPANAVVSIPANKKILIVYPDGRQETASGPSRIQISTPPPSELDFLAAPINALPIRASDGGQEIDGAIHLTSPVGVTRFLNPTIAWTASEGKVYDVAVVDPADEIAPPRIARGVRPPIQVSGLESKQGPTLPADRILAVIVRVSGEPEGVTNRFLTSEDATIADLPTEPSALIAEAISALTHKPFRVGDAWVALSRLPEPWSHCELALRLRLKVAIELGLVGEVRKLNTELGKGM